MKNLSRILTMMLCFAPLCVSAAGTVATTAGNNLTAFNPSNANNNQWANMSNGRYDTNTTAKADFGNCEAVISRCAKPRCINGGCADMSVAIGIVSGCVQSNKTCKQYGDALIQSISAQLVSSSNAKINEQNAAAQQAAAVAAQQAAQQSAAQMQEMQYQMQQMQQQMAQQQAESQQQLQAALAQQAAQSAAAVESMKSAATAATMENEAGISGYQQEAINRGISADVLERKKITGQIITELENAETSLKEVKVAMNTAFEYAKCDARGNNCEGPKRIKKWRELATEFLTPYDNTIDKVYDALELAQLVGVNLSDIYMMLNNSCNRWGQYMCESGAKIEYIGNNNAPYSCSSADLTADETTACYSEWTNVYQGKAASQVTESEKLKVYNDCKANLLKSKCKPCTLLKVLSSGDEVYEGWVNPTVDSTSNGTVVACASSALDSSALFARRTKNKNGSGLVDIDKLDTWLNQKEPSKSYRNGLNPMDYCNAESDVQTLEKAVLSRQIPKGNPYFCVDGLDNTNVGRQNEEECPYINPVYAICDIHPYNAGKTNMLQTSNSVEDQCSKEKAQAQCSAENGADCDKISFAVLSGSKCVYKWCGWDYKPTDKGCQKVADDTWKNYENCKEDKGTKGCLAVYNEYDAQIKAKYGETKEIIGLKITVVSQQMYKQYEYLNATLRRLKTQLEKATLTATLEAAGAKTDSGSSSGLLGSGNNDDKTIHLAGAENCNNKMDYESVYTCVQSNATLIINSAKINTKKACSQLKETVKSFNVWAEKAKIVSEDKCLDTNVQCTKDEVQRCAQLLLQKVAKERADSKKAQQKINYGYMQMPQ